MALKQFEFSGSHYDIGVALGRLSADSILNVIPGMERVIALRKLWLGSDRLKQIESAARSAFPDYMQEMDGIADGATCRQSLNRPQKVPLDVRRLCPAGKPVTSNRP